MNVPQPRTYRPACFVRLYVRLEDFGAGDESDAQDGAAPYKDVKVKKIVQRALIEAKIAQQTAGGRSKSDLVGLYAASKALWREAGKLANGSAAGPVGDGDEFSIEFVTAPLELTIEDKGFREADTMEAMIPFQDVPLHPLLMRECRVEAWVGTVTRDDFASPERWHLEPRMSKTSVLRFNGYVDLAEMEYDETNGSIHLKCRSYISVLIDGKMSPKAKDYRIDGAEEYITAYINRILRKYPPTSGDTGGDPFRAYWYASPANREPKISRKTLNRSLQTASSRNAAANQSVTSDVNAQPDPDGEAADAGGVGDAATTGNPMMPTKGVTEDGMAIWDLITQACELCGVIPMYRPTLPPFEGSLGGKAQTIDPVNCLLVTPPESFLDDISNATQIAGGARDGFKREFSNGSGGTFKSDVRFMVWGHNIAKMKLSRKMGKLRPVGVEVRAYNPDANDTLRVLSARFPRHIKRQKKAKGHGANRMHEKGGGKIDAVKIFVLKGIRDQHALEMAAVSLYHQLTRPEISMEIETDELASYIDPIASQAAGVLVENHNDNPDILRLCAGTPVHITVARKSDQDGGMVISSLSDFYDLQGNNIVDILLKQNDRWGAFRRDGSMDPGRIAETARKIQAAYGRAKLPTIYYCRSVRLHFAASDEIFHATMELTNYMPSNDPSQMDDVSQQLNDERKRRPTSTKLRVQAAARAKTDAIVDRSIRSGAK
jgi:hypothetical protein